MWIFIVLTALGGLMGVIGGNYCGLPFLLTVTSCLFLAAAGAGLALALIGYIYNNCEFVCDNEKIYAIRPHGETFWYYIDNDELVDYYDENGKLQTTELSNIVMAEKIEKPQLIIREIRIKNLFLHILLGVGCFYESVLQVPYH